MRILDYPITIWDRFIALINRLNRWLPDYPNMPRWSEHVLFWTFIGYATYGQYSRQFSTTPGLTHNINAMYVIWISQLTMSIVSFIVIGYYVLPRFWYTGKIIQNCLSFATYWFVSSYLTEVLFKYIALNYQPLPHYITLRLALYAKNTWVGYFADPGLFFFNWAQNFSYIIIPLLIKLARDQKKEAQKMQEFVQEKLMMELNFLRSQINPHFLFNAFNNLYGLIRRNDKLAADTLHDLSEVMRYAIYKTNSDIVPLKGELRFLANYLRLESIRFTRQTSITCDVKGDPGSYGIPPMIIVSFLENAYKHGLNSSLGRGFLTINITIDNLTDMLIIQMVNSKDPSFRAATVGGVGIVNVRKRLDLLYPDAYSLELSDQKTTYHVDLKIPLVVLSRETLNDKFDTDDEQLFPLQLLPTQIAA